MRALGRRAAGAVASLCLASVVSSAQDAPRLTRHDAEQQALRNHPQVSGAEDYAQAADEAAREARSAYFPTAFGSLTGAAAQAGSRIAAGGLNNPIILDRLAVGVSIGQLITDFGRTRDLVQVSALRADAQHQDVDSRRADVLLQVDRSYFNVLRAQAVERVAEETVKARQLVVDQVTALAESRLRSGLDVSFAKVNLAEAQLLVVQARNERLAALTSLSAAMGSSDAGVFELVDEPLPPPPPPDSAALVAQALGDRPDVAGERLTRQAASRFADAERALWWPTVSAVASAGLVPSREAGLNSRYSAAGVNVNVPMANGGLFSARGAEATFRARAEEQRLRDLENRVARDVRTAWLDAQTSFQRVDLTAQLLAQASDASDLAQSRYDLGLSSIVELSQAQLNKTRAALEEAAARYDYQARTAVLKFQMGALR